MPSAGPKQREKQKWEALQWWVFDNEMITENSVKSSDSKKSFDLELLELQQYLLQKQFKSLKIENENLKTSQQLFEKEIQSLKESQFCKICVNNEMNTALLPCGHLVTCNECASILKDCPMCRKNINDKIRIYMS